MYFFIHSSKGYIPIYRTLRTPEDDSIESPDVEYSTENFNLNSHDKLSW